ncbi:MAG TPA: hypothetical protein DCE42_11925, partial [Myxococcales bacterium]|nr:hypothetical protein [Myxococcales bacterium]
MRRYPWIVLVSLFFLVGCQDPYSNQKAPPSSKETSKFGSYQNVFNNTYQGPKGGDSGVERWKVETGNAYNKGNTKALVTIVEFSDFQCPFCSRGAKTLDGIVKKYKGKVRLYFKHYPLSFHKDAHLASQASLAAGAQGKFWEYHDKLFANQKKLKRPDLERYAKELKLDMKKFKAALDKGTYKKQVDDDFVQGGQVNVSGTPTAYVNGRKTSVDAKKIGELVDEELKLAAGAKTTGDAYYTELIKKAKSNKPKKIAKKEKKEEVIQNVSVGNSPNTGPEEAPITIVEFSDFECPYCSRGAKTAKKVKKAYGDKVQLVFKHYPLAFHIHAKPAAYASMAAREQGQFWAYHDKLFANSKKLDRASLLKYAKELGLDIPRFTQNMDSYAVKAHIDSDMKQASKVGVTGTPAFFINGRMISGAQPFSKFKEVIDEILIKKGFKKSELPEEPAEVVEVGNAYYKGSKDAPVQIVEFSDFQCPFCSRGANTLNLIAKAYKNKVQVAFKHFPLSFHKDAPLASQAALAAGAQGKFWEYHDLLFENQKKLKRPDLDKYAKELGLNMSLFALALDTAKYKAQVDADLAQGSKIGVSGTPTIFINGRKAKGNTFEELKKQIDPILLKNGYKKSDLPEKPKRVIKVGNAYTKGNPKAKVTIVEFSDFQCPFCSRGARQVGEFIKYYKDHVRLVFKHFPLSFHKEAHLASQASLAAGAQGKFWEYHDRLFANQRKLKRPDLERYAQSLGLDMQKFKAALDNGTYKGQVDADLKQGGKNGVSGTPTMFINGEKAKGYKFDELKKQVDPILLKLGVKKEALPKRPPKVVKIGDAPYKGSPKAKVQVVEFSDFQCPYCSRAANTLNTLAKAYGDKIQVVFKQYPLGFHKDAHLAAQASLAAHAQGKFWAYHDKLFANQRALKRPQLEAYAQQLGLDMGKFKAALDNGTYKAKVDAEMANGTYIGVNGTPSVFINNKPAIGLSFEKLKEQIDPILLKNGYKQADLPEKPLKRINTKGAYSKGNPNAPIKIVEFSDFQCPFCSRAVGTLKKLQKAYGDKVQIFFMNFPLSFHKDAHLASQAALAAGEQAKFWEYHDKLFA